MRAGTPWPTALIPPPPSSPWTGADRPWRRAPVGDATGLTDDRFVQPVLALFARVLKQGGRAWVAEPGREVYQAFLQGLDSGGWRGRRVHVQKVDALYAQTVPVTVAVWEIARGPRA